MKIVAGLRSIDRLMNNPTLGLILMLVYFVTAVVAIIYDNADWALLGVIGFLWELNKAELRDLRNRIERSRW